MTDRWKITTTGGYISTQKTDADCLWYIKDILSRDWSFVVERLSSGETREVLPNGKLYPKDV